IILEPLKDAGERGIEVVGGDGLVRLVFPILTCYVPTILSNAWLPVPNMVLVQV
ncbi:hypothetical protein BDR05DRAFT_896590, partial [Suillus weaverae]